MVAMSGGVDSTVAAVLLREHGYEVIGLTFATEYMQQPAADAARVAVAMNIEHHVVDAGHAFTSEVIDYFTDEYLAGRTPNPCIRCNRHIKFGLLLDEALALGADLIATGHYARVEHDPELNRYLLKKGADVNKDQSYLLYSLTQHQLKHIILPMGDIDKNRARTIARDMNLPNADSSESQEICFVSEEDYAGFVVSQSGRKIVPGPILDLSGNTVGAHKGVVYYTVGQRKGLGISSKQPLYVIRIDSERNTLVVGTEEHLYSDELLAGDVNYIAERPDTPIEIKAKIRYKHIAADGILTPAENDTARVKFRTPQKAIAPGQSVVFYVGDNVIGGGIIDKRIIR